MSALKQGTRVKFKIGSVEGIGKVVGTTLPKETETGLVSVYIIEPDESISTSHYPYSHFTAVETQLQVLKGVLSNPRTRLRKGKSNKKKNARITANM